MTGNGGTGSLQYSVDAGISFQSSGTFTGLSASTYNIIVEDINGCQTAGSITLNDPIAISYSATSTNENCGSGDGSLTLNASGGSGSFQYSIDGGTNFQSSGSFTGLTAGNYNVVIEDTFGCQTSGIETVGSSGGAVISNITSVHPTCNGYNDGSISITASGNALPLTYSIDGGTTFQSSGSFSGLAGNTYNIVVLDANSCQITASVTLTDPPAITYTTTSVHPYCNGDLNGSISLIASGGTGSLQYSIDGGTTFQSSGAFINLSAGTYSIVIEDANGCQSTGSVTLNDPPALSYTSSVINETCGNANGSITLTGTGGNGSLQYSIDGGVNFQSSGTFTGLTGFTYNIIIQDANGCQATGSETVNSEDSPVITSINTTDPLCYGGNGSIVIITSGGTGMLQYSIDGGNNFGASASFNTPSGNYSIVVEDANGCQVVGNTVLNDPQIISFTTTSTGENCGAMDATITINGSGGTGSLIYSINGGTNFQTTGSFTGLSSGSYNIVVQDDNGCQVTGTEIISSIGGSTISNIASTDPSCYGDNDGIISITASGINTPLQYSVDGGTTFQTSGTFSSISSGNYIIVVEDAIGCQTFDSIVVNDPPALTYISSSIDENCGAGDGALSFMPSGGSGSYQFSIDGGTTFYSSGTFNNLASGSYNIVIQDGNGCQVTGIENIGSIGGATITSLTSTDPLCYGDNTGSINVIASGGTGTLSYSIDGGVTFQSNGTFSGIAGGNYTIMVEDGNGCQTFSNITLNEPDEIITSISITEATCDSSNGSATVSISGGTGTLTYLWSDSANQTTPTANNLYAGIYLIVVTDNNGCIATDSAIVGNLGDPTVLITSTDVTCFGDSNGTASTIVIGGISPYTYLWNDPNSQSTSTANGLSAGNYLVQITDDVGCIAFETITIYEPYELINIVTTINTSCGMNNGLAISNIQGGTQPYSILWDDPAGQISPAAINLSPGNYSVYVIDANNCSSTDSIAIINSDSLIVYVDVSHETCEGEADGSISTFISQGTSPYQYLWSTGDTTAVLTGLSAGEYTLNVSDSLACSAMLVIPIGTENENCIIIPTAISPNGDGSNDVWDDKRSYKRYRYRSRNI